MAARGPYRLTLTTTPQRIDLAAADSTAGSHVSARTLPGTVDWFLGGPDMTAVAGATPGAQQTAGEWADITVTGDDEWWACVATGTVELHRNPAGI